MAAGILAAGADRTPVRAEGPVAVTVTGAIDATNRGPFDPFADALFAALDLSFERAYAFTRAELAALPQHELTAQYPNWPGPVTVRGPMLADVLDSVGATGTQIAVRAMDGYAPSFTRAQIDGFVLALSRDGTPLALGGRGPAWLVIPPERHPMQPVEDDSLLTWGVVHIAVSTKD
jgi:hypothetical protein